MSTSWLFVVLIILIAGGYYYLRKSKNKFISRLLTPKSDINRIVSEIEREKAEGEKLDALWLARQELMRQKKRNNLLRRSITEVNEDNVDKPNPKSIHTT